MSISSTFIHIKELLNNDQLSNIKNLLASAPYDDGKNTATDSARDVKSNLQVNMQSQQYGMIQQILLGALNQNETFRNALYPKNIYPFLISKYTAGNEYGWHVDNPLMGNMMRTDVAMTIFLNAPEDYEGGELELEIPSGTLLYKLKKGDAICYPCMYLHRVKQLISGERHVAVTWIQSLVKENEERGILYDMQQVLNTLKKSASNSREQLVLQQSHSNLLRKWSE